MIFGNDRLRHTKAAAPNVLDAGGTLSELSFRIH